MAEELGTILMNLQCELVAERNLVNPDQITWLQYDILTALGKGPQLPSELSRALGVSRSKLSKSLAGLRSLGYIEQQPGASDHRALITGLTDRGKDFLAGIDAGHQHLVDVAQKALTVEEQEEFARLAARLDSQLHRERMSRG